MKEVDPASRPYDLCGHTATLKTEKEVRVGELFERGGGTGCTSLTIPVGCVDTEEEGVCPVKSS